MKILVTGFDPFGGEKVNPALEAVKSLPSVIHGAEIRWVEIPTVFYKSAEVLEAEINRYHPDVVLCIGQAGGRASLTPERVAINQDDARIPDNQGNQPIDTPIRLDGEYTPYQSNGTSHKRGRTTSFSIQFSWNLCLQPFDVSGSLFSG